eukprot:TRINITY_DN30599_c0_g2_i1.p1 TRINITY_DN30599_c0_g2~~TRINITY_DN30599_c0_g2_i1.p1  ORF type:complete len:668 (-),score=94.89 TRINITY_DN30599_c0_g2_i1:107-1876(-)
MAPLHYFYGLAPGHHDWLSKLSMDNIHDNSWLYWVHAFLVWYVILAVSYIRYQAYDAFVDRRFRWLQQMDEVRARTVLVQNIPKQHRSDAALVAYFHRMFHGNRVQAASVVKKAGKLKKLISDCRAAKAAQLKVLNAEIESQNPNDDEMQILRGSSPPDYSKRAIDLEELVSAERNRILLDAQQVDSDINTSSGFVTFHSRRDAQMALFVKFTDDRSQWVMSSPPHPADVSYDNLAEDPTYEQFMNAMGVLCMASLYLIYVPCVVGITQAARWVTLSPFIQPFWDALVPTMGLTLFMSFLPTIIVLIGEMFWVQPGTSWLQYDIQVWYFYFMFIFVLLVTVIGQSLVGKFAALVDRPTLVFVLFAEKLPRSTNFYLNYIILHWSNHVLSITRYLNLIKYLLYRVGKSATYARDLSEPEDQDFYGIGSRSARWTINLLVGLLFCQICPLICLAVLIDCLICRCVYGYLIVFAETRKRESDLGGVFFQKMLSHMNFGLAAYWVLMVGVLLSRVSHKGPALIAASSGMLLVYSQMRIDKREWRLLPFEKQPEGEFQLAEGQLLPEDAMQCGTLKTGKCLSFVQPELLAVQHL